MGTLCSNIYMRRFIVGFKHLGFAQHYRVAIVNYADDFCVLGKAPAAEMLRAVKRIMEALKLPLNEQKTRCLRCPEEALEFLGYRIGWNYRPTNGSRYIGTRPSASSVKHICHEIPGRELRLEAALSPREFFQVSRTVSGGEGCRCGESGK